MAKMSYEALKVYVANLVTIAKLSLADFTATKNNTVGLLDKVGKIVVLDTEFQVDKLAIFDGEYLSYAKTIEEWSEDLLMIEDHDPDGAHALSPHRPTYRPVFYSYTLGRKKIATTIDYDDLERAVHFADQYVTLIAMKYKRISDSMAAYRYQIKREMIGKFYAITQDSKLGLGDAGDTATWSSASSTGWNSAVNKEAKNGLFVLKVNITSSSLNGVYIAVKPIAQASTKTLTELIADGSLIKLDLVKEIAKPVDDTTGEAFIKQLKEDVEVAGDLSEGHSLNGNSLGATEGLVLIMKQGVMPSLEVDTWAGAFQEKMLALPAEKIVVKDFGSENDGVYAVLCDKRCMRLHNTYNATRENLNGDGDFLNVFRHTEDTAYISRNVFVKFYKNV